LASLKRKVDAGAGQLISQLFFDNDRFYGFLDAARAAGIDVPIEAGIMPVTNARQTARIAKLCGVELPKKFLKITERWANDETAMRDAGIAYATDQIVDLVSHGVDGVHLYTMNNAYVAGKIKEATGSLF
jgi:methylenetetrahydrofolate reductase (NADPH)